MAMAAAQYQIIIIGLPILIAIGDISTIIGLIVFLEKSMRKNSCILFIISHLVFNFININFTILQVVLGAKGIQTNVQSKIACHLYMYIGYISSIIPTYLLIMASFDRMCISSSSVRIRSMVNRRVALCIIGGICVFWAIFHLHAFFDSDVQLIYGTLLACYTRSGGPTIFLSYYSLILDGLLPVTLMAAFGIQTIRNVQRIERVRCNQRDRFLILLLIIQLSIYIFLRIPTSIYLLYQQITSSYVKSTDQLVLEEFILVIIMFCQFTQITVFPLINIVTKGFRREFKHVIGKILGRTNGQVGSHVTKTVTVTTFQMQRFPQRSFNINSIEPTP